MSLPQKWKIVLVTIAGTFMVILDQTITNIALPHIMSVFNETTDKAQLVVSAYLMASAITMPLAAYLGTRFGIKWVYLFSQAGFLLGSILCGLSWDINSLIFFRVIQGLCGGLLQPIAMTLLFTNVPPEERGTTMAIFGIPMMLGPAIGPTLGGYLVDYWDWRMCFYVNVPVVIIAILIGYAWVEDSARTKMGFDFKGFTFAAIGLSLVLYGLSYAPTWGWSDSRIISLMTVGIASIGIWIWMELRGTIPMLDLHVFKYPGFSVATGVNFVTTIGLFSTIFLLPMFLQNLRGLSAFDTGLLLIWGAIGPMLTMPLSGRMYDKIGPRVPVILGLTITAAATLFFQILDVTTSDNVIRILLLVRGMGMGLAMMPVMTYGLAAVPLEKTGQASALTSVARTVFASLGVAIFATMLDGFQKTNLATLTQLASPNSPEALGILSGVQVAALKMGVALEAARAFGISLLYQMVQLKASVMAFDTDFLISAIVAFGGILPAWLLPHGAIKKNGNASRAIPME
jgi:EmrB/QacA subfamily drug resistance transporter